MVMGWEMRDKKKNYHRFEGIVKGVSNHRRNLTESFENDMLRMAGQEGLLFRYKEYAKDFEKEIKSKKTKNFKYSS